MSPDPYLSGLISGEAIYSMSSAGVISRGRHFLLNEQETNRTSGFSIADKDVKLSVLEQI